jgi:hypothetical protein
MAAACPPYCHWMQAINVAQWQPGGEVCLVSQLAGARDASPYLARSVSAKAKLRPRPRYGAWSIHIIP